MEGPMNRLTAILVLGSVAALMTGCSGGSALSDTEAAVFLVPEVTLYNPEVNVCASLLVDLTVDEMSIRNESKDPDGDVTANQDVLLRTWESTPYRTDGGSTATPVWTNDQVVTVPAGGDVDLENYRVYGSEFLDDPPLNYLYPENGGVDPETGEPIIRQSITLKIYGRTVSGKRVATEPIAVAFRFFCL
jgi:hypothetical protein